MTEQGYKPERQADLDGLLDAALAKYAAVEPRAGLEGRILANLRSHPARTARRAWWGWSLAAAFTVAIVIAILVWRPEKPSHPVIAHKPETIQPATQHAPIIGKRRREPVRTHSTKPRQNIDRAQPVLAAQYPKRDQFPSPQPLSEQEEILKRFIQQYPDDAALLAEARTESLRRDLEERQRIADNKDSE